MEAVDRGESISAMEPLLIPDGSRQRAPLNDLAFDLTAGLNIRHYQKVEEGTVNVTLRTVELLAQAFGVDVADMFQR